MPQTLCIDEHMVPYTGHSSLNQYILNKPYKYGYKIFCFVTPVAFYTTLKSMAEKFFQLKESLTWEQAANIVLHLTTCIAVGRNHLIYFKTWFTSLPLITTHAKKEYLCSCKNSFYLYFKCISFEFSNFEHIKLNL